MRWALRKAPENLTDRQRIALARVQHTNARRYRAYLLKEQLRALYHLDDPGDRGHEKLPAGGRVIPHPSGSGSTVRCFCAVGREDAHEEWKDAGGDHRPV